MIFHTIGILIGCCVRTESILSLPLSKVFWKILVSDRLCLPDLLHVDPGLYMVPPFLIFF